MGHRTHTVAYATIRLQVPRRCCTMYTNVENTLREPVKANCVNECARLRKYRGLRGRDATKFTIFHKSNATKIVPKWYLGVVGPPFIGIERSQCGSSSDDVNFITEAECRKTSFSEIHTQSDSSHFWSIINTYDAFVRAARGAPAFYENTP